MAVAILERSRNLDARILRSCIADIRTPAWPVVRVEGAVLADALAAVLDAVEHRHRSLKGTLDELPPRVAIDRMCDCLDAFDAVVRLAQVLEVELPVLLEEVAPRNRYRPVRRGR